MKQAGVSSILVAVLLLVAGVIAEAQQAAKIPLIGVLNPTSATIQANRIDAFRRRLRELSYVEGKNIFLEIRYADGKADRLFDLATELIRLKVDVIVTATRPGVLAAMKA